MHTLAIIILVVLGLYIVVGSILKKKLLLSKFVVIIAVLAIGMLLLSSQFSSNDSQDDIQAYQKIAPSVQNAPFMVQTSSRAYYVSTYLDTDDALTLTNYYFYDEKKWEKSSIPLPLDKSIYGELKVHKRIIGG